MLLTVADPFTAHRGLVSDDFVSAPLPVSSCDT